MGARTMRRFGWLAGLAMMAFGTSAYGQAGDAANPTGAPPSTEEPTKPNAPTTSPSDANSQEAIGSKSAPKQAEKNPSQGTSSFAANQVAGRVTSVNRSSKQLTIDEAGQQKEMKIPDNVTVFVNGRLGSIDDLREGQEVRAAYEERSGQKSLRWIEVKPVTNNKADQKQGAATEDAKTDSPVAAPSGDKNDTTKAAPDAKSDAAQPQKR